MRHESKEDDGNREDGDTEARSLVGLSTPGPLAVRARSGDDYLTEPTSSTSRKTCVVRAGLRSERETSVQSLLSSNSTREFSCLVLTVTTGASTQHVFSQHGLVSASFCPSAPVNAGRASDVDLRQQTRLGNIMSWPAPSRRAPRLDAADDPSARASRSVQSLSLAKANAQ